MQIMYIGEDQSCNLKDENKVMEEYEKYTIEFYLSIV